MSQSNETEIEVKFYLSKPQEFEQHLMNQGAVLVRPRTLEKNIRFDTPDGRLTETRQVLRLRQDDRIWLTYKSTGEFRSDVTVRKEIEFEAGDFTAAFHFLEALGYQAAVRYEKYRTVYQAWGLMITLDEMPYGFFCELEGPSGEGIEASAARLGLDWSSRVLLSYLAILDALKQTGRFHGRNLTFEEFANLAVGQADFQKIGIFTAD
jgi:adenylate cyclase class 2